MTAFNGKLCQLALRYAPAKLRICFPLPSSIHQPACRMPHLTAVVCFAEREKIPATMKNGRGVNMLRLRFII